jgi:hypothetical protein
MADPSPSPSDTELDQEEIGRRSRETWPAWTPSPSPFAAPAAPWRINWSLPPAEAAAAPESPASPPLDRWWQAQTAPEPMPPTGSAAPAIEERPPGPGQPGAAGPPTDLQRYPPGGANVGRVMVNDATGERFRSDGTQWVPIPAAGVPTPTATPILEDRATRAGVPAVPTAVAPTVAQGAVNALAPGGVPVVQRAGQYFAQFDRLSDALAANEKAREIALETKRKEQAATLDRAKAAMEDHDAYLKAIGEKPLAPPTLKTTPAAPDVKIRPWLDPEGKDALSVIVQSLGMLAVGTMGISQKAPLTAMKYFREAAENWRRDEVDAANSKLKQFEMTMTGIKNDNEVALKQYEIADKERTFNVEAKKALVLSKLQEAGLGDKQLALASQPYDDARKSIEDQLGAAKAGLDGLDKYFKIAAATQKSLTALPKTPDGAMVNLADIKTRLADPATTPDQRTELLRQQTINTDFLNQHVKLKQETDANSNLIRSAGVGLTKAQDAVTQIDGAANRLNELYDAYKILNDAAGPLAASRTKLDEFAALVRRNVKAYPPKVQAAMRVVESFTNPTVVGVDRAFFGDKGGSRAKEAYTLLTDRFVPWNEARGMFEFLGRVLTEERSRQQHWADTHNAVLKGATTGGVPSTPSAPAAAPTETPAPAEEGE